MSNPWEEMRRAKEEEYFKKQNQEALRKLAEKQPEAQGTEAECGSDCPFRKFLKFVTRVFKRE